MSRTLQQITDWAERAGRALWCIDTLAKNCGVSESTLGRFFHETKGQSPRDWTLEERMRRARELLERPERIKDIAELLGYGHQRNFTTAFTRYHGYAPSFHRKQVRSPQAQLRKC